MWRALGVMIAVSLGACLEPSTFVCSEDSQCTQFDRSGMCEPASSAGTDGGGNAGRCSFADPQCDSSQRYEAYADDEKAGTCVPCGLLDARCCSGARCTASLVCGGERCTCVRQLAAAARQTCALKTDGTVWCLGESATRPDGFPLLSLEEVLLTGIPAARSISLGVYSCVIDYAAKVHCWAPTLSVRDFALPPAVAVTVGTPSQVCSLGTDSVLWCIDPMGSSATEKLRDVIAGHGSPTHACAVQSNGTVQCWGDNTNGGLGDGTVTARTTPAPVVGLAPASQVSCGSRFACAVLRDGSVWCWGANNVGALGDGTRMQSLVPVRVSGITGALEVETTARGACARTHDAVWCWGDGSLLGGLSSTAPQRIDTLPRGVEQIVAGGDHVCARRGAETWCWGYALPDPLLGYQSALIPAPAIAPIHCSP